MMICIVVVIFLIWGITVPTFACESLGVDLGIGSCGWAVIWRGGSSETILTGARTFDVPENEKDRTPTNQIRRGNRLMRRTIRRRARRKAKVRELCGRFGLVERLPESAAVDPWQARAAGLDRPLSGAELAAALRHIAGHRGFKSTSKRDRGRNAPDDSSKMLKEIAESREKMTAAGWRTVGEMFASDPRFADRKRNRDGDYSRSVLRDDLAHEVRELFKAQRRFGNPLATTALEEDFAAVAFFQRGVRDSEDKVGRCRFLPDEQRAALRSYSFERFRLLSRLAALTVRCGRVDRRLTPEEIAAAGADFGKQSGLSFKRLRTLAGIGDDWRFDGIKSESDDVAARSGTATPGTYALRRVLPDGVWRGLLATPERLDRIASVLSFRDDLASIRAGLSELDLEPAALQALVEAAERGDFTDFRRAGHLSAAACRALIPHLAQGLVYSDACKAAGFDHTAPLARFDLRDRDAFKQAVAAVEKDIANPIARKALTEGLKQVRTLVLEFGLPESIHVELARDVGKSPEERYEIEQGIEKRTAAKDKLRLEYRGVVGRDCAGAEDLLRYELWKEQNGFCLYTGEPIPPSALVAGDNSVQVDHILPWSRSGDDSFVNKTLCLARANQEKRGRTPFEWFGDDETRWATFTASVESLKTMKGRKKRNLLLKDAKDLEKRFRERNLNDTRYACRALIGLLEGLYPNDGRRHVFARPGPLTDRLRRAWGIQGLTKGPDGQRLDDDRHHALDALIVAATSESALQRLTAAVQAEERHGAPRDLRAFALPWPSFVEDARAALAKVFVSRAERHRARGEGHGTTIRQIAERDGVPGVYERKAVEKLTLADLDRIKDPERNHRLVAALRDWIERGKPKDDPPKSPKGDPIAKVRLLTNKKPDVLVREGAADRGDMVRVDVFRKAGRKGAPEFFLVPIYPHQVMNPEGWPEPPKKTIQAGKDEGAGWPEIGPEHEFLFSLRRNSFIEVVKPDGEIIEGYFRGADRNTGALILNVAVIGQAQGSNNIRKGIGSRTLRSIRKFHVDRLGRRSEVEREKRTWHGVVCT